MNSPHPKASLSKHFSSVETHGQDARATTLLRASFSKQFANGPQIAADLLEISAPGVTVLFGPSGSGKTTILRCLAGLETPDTGEIIFAGEKWFFGGQTLVPPRNRHLGFVPQDYALFPHLTVAANIGYGLKGRPAGEINSRVAELLTWLDLKLLAHRLPAELSGGQQQRVALARAVARQPKLLLLDEPLSALDAPTRQKLRAELRQLLRQLAIPVIVVTHDRLEALALGDQLIVMDQGRILQRGTVQEVFNRPANLAVAAIVAVETVQPGRIQQLQYGLASVKIGNVQLIAAADLPVGTTEVFVCIRAEDVILSTDTEQHTSARNRLSGTVRAITSEGPMTRIELDCGFPLTVLLTKQACDELALRENSSVIALVKAPQIHLVPRGA